MWIAVLIIFQVREGPPKGFRKGRGRCRLGTAALRTKTLTP
jgi:hypothetical protein